ncbi:MAG: response regulator [Anaerolineales bacterium]|nr:response regulator [Anaerolineales bacterium]
MARILVIEDNADSLELAAYLLQAAGHRADGASAGEAALAAARQDPPDLILCDLQLPGMDGFAVLRGLRQEPRLCAIPVVAVTAYAMVGDHERVLAAGFNGYLSKPIDPEQFTSQVEAFLPRRS